MANFELIKNTARAAVINKDATLNDGVRAAVDLDNATDKDNFGDFFLTVQWNTTAPAANTIIGELYVLPGDGAGTEKFPEGGDGTVGSDDTPQKQFMVGTFESINPSLTVDETLEIKGVELRPVGNRVVLINTSGEQFDLTYQLDYVGYKWSST